MLGSGSLENQLQVLLFTMCIPCSFFIFLVLSPLICHLFSLFFVGWGRGDRIVKFHANRTFSCLQWVGCDNRTCRRWVHVDCEVSAGNKVDSTAYYLCPSCREVGTHLPLSIHPSHQSVSLGLLLHHHLGCGMCMFKYSIVQLNVFLSHVFWHVHQTCDITCYSLIQQVVQNQ